MLSINNVEDIPKMKRYYRANDMINLLYYFPDISPIKNLTIVEDLEDLDNNYDFYKQFAGERNDTLITKSSMKSIEGSGINPDLKSILKKVKEIDSDGVLLLFDLCHEPSERFERYAGIAVSVDVGYCVCIEAVGKGFDGREVSKGICTHERYYIPWFDLRKINIASFHDYQVYQISNEEYQKSREERIEFLKSIGLDEKIFSKYIPTTYEPIPDFIWLSVISGILKKLEEKEDILVMDGFTHFAISGHTEGKKFLPWQMFDKNRYIKKNVILSRK